MRKSILWMFVFVFVLLSSGCGTGRGLVRGISEDYQALRKADKWFRENLW